MKKLVLHYMLDAVITVVDAVHAMQQLDEYEEAQMPGWICRQNTAGRKQIS